MATPCSALPATLAQAMHSAHQSCSPATFLPAWRWAGAPGTFSEKLGSIPGHIIDYIILEASTGAFIVSDWIWRIIMILAQISELITSAILQLNPIIDHDFHAVGTAVDNSYIGPILLIVLLVSVAFSAAFGRGHGRHLRNFFLGMIPIAILLMMVTASGYAQTISAVKSNGGAVGPPGTPSWVLHQALTLTQPLKAAITKFNSGEATNMLPTTHGNPSCKAYTKVLTTYARTVGSNKTATIMDAVSNLWLASQYSLFAQAQFGIGNPAGPRAACHWAEIVSGVPDDEQQALQMAVWAPGGNNFTAAQAIDFGPSVMNPSSGTTVADTERVLDAWGICQYKSGTGWTSTTEFSHVTNSGKPVTWRYFCQTFWNEWPNPKKTTQAAPKNTGEPNPITANFGGVTTGSTKVTGPDIPGGIVSSVSIPGCSGTHQCKSTDPFYYNYAGAVQNATNTNNTTTGGATPSKPVTGPAATATALNAQASQFLQSVNGHIGMGGAIAGLVALVTSAAYLLGLGGVLLFLTASMIGVVVWLILSPFWLIMWAAPQWRRHAKRATRLGMSMLFTYVFFGLLVGMMIMIMSIVQTVIGALPIPDASLLSLIAPLVAWYLLRFGSQKLGIGKLTGLRGAANLTLGTMAMSRAGQMDPIVRGMRRGKSPLGNALDRFDNRMPGSKARRMVAGQRRREGWALARGAHRQGRDRKTQLDAAKGKLPGWARLAVRSGATDRIWKARNMANAMWRSKKTLGLGAAGAAGAGALIAGRQAARGAGFLARKLGRTRLFEEAVNPAVGMVRGRAGGRLSSLNDTHLRPAMGMAREKVAAAAAAAAINAAAFAQRHPRLSSIPRVSRQVSHRAMERVAAGVASAMRASPNMEANSAHVQQWVARHAAAGATSASVAAAPVKETPTPPVVRAPIIPAEGISVGQAEHLVASGASLSRTGDSSIMNVVAGGQRVGTIDAPDVAAGMGRGEFWTLSRTLEKVGGNLVLGLRRIEEEIREDKLNQTRNRQVGTINGLPGSQRARRAMQQQLPPPSSGSKE